MLKFLKSTYSNVKEVLSKTRSLIGNKLRALFQGKIDESTLDQLEQLLYEADLGVNYAQELTEKVRQRLKQNPDLDSAMLLEGLRQDILHDLMVPLKPSHEFVKNVSPQIILIIGVNGNGKTTSVAKLAHYYQEEGKKVIVAAADTFRAAAMEQLETWAHRLNIDIVKGNAKSDPAAVAFDGISAGQARGADVVIIDTAGRLHTKIPLMQELEKIRRSCRKVNGDAPHETFLVLDATTGQNAIDQAKTFNQFTPISGLILTKLDGTAKGGIVLAIHRQLGIPVRFIGVGEGIEDLQVFDPKVFVDALFD